MEKISLIGNRYGRLTVVELAEKRKRKDRKEYNYYYLCQCDCGNKKIVGKNNLKNGITQSCGCWQKEIATKNINKINVKHGFSRHDGTKEKLYNVWHAMKSRCENKNDKAYKYYGARGILVCEDWKNDYIAFRTWALLNNYKRGLDIDRINNDGNYEPSNCRFITHRENLLNRRKYAKRKSNNKIAIIDTPKKELTANSD